MHAIIYNNAWVHVHACVQKDGVETADAHGIPGWDRVDRFGKDFDRTVRVSCDKCSGQIAQTTL